MLECPGPVIPINGIGQIEKMDALKPHEFEGI